MRRAVLIEALENRTLLAAVPVISGNGITIANGDPSATQSDGTNFAWAEVGGSLTRQFTIQNTGDTDLLIAAPTISGTDGSAFTVVQAPTGAIAPGQSVPLIVQFAPQAQRSYVALFSLQTNSPATPEYGFTIGGSGIKTKLLPGGLRYGIASAGTGSAARNGQLLTMNYTGWLRGTGVVFDTSLKEGRSPFQFVIGSGAVIEGWDRGLIGMRPNEQRVLFIPSALGYGQNGSGSTIPPNSDLIFQTQLVSIATPQVQVVSASSAGNPEIPNGDKAWSVAKGTALYANPTDTTATSLLAMIPQFSAGYGQVSISATGSGAGQFTFEQAPYQYNQQIRLIQITYTPSPGVAKADAKVRLAFATTGSPVYSFAIHGERLASGVTLTSEALAAQGTGGNDVISLSRSGARYALRVGAAANTFNMDDITSVSLSGGTGDDKITVNNNVSLGVTIDGGDGRNTLTGGSGPDVIRGGAGDDRITGNAGNDSLSGGLGSDLLVGGSGTNTYFTIDAVADVLDARRGSGDVGQWDDSLDVLRGVVSPIA